MLAYKKKKIKRALKTLNKERLSDLQKRVSVTNDLLKVLQVQMLENPTTENFEAERERCITNSPSSEALRNRSSNRNHV